jgi:hypothetical protein
LDNLVNTAAPLSAAKAAVAVSRDTGRQQRSLAVDRGLWSVDLAGAQQRLAGTQRLMLLVSDLVGTP